MNNHLENYQMWRMKDVCNYLKLSRTTVYRLRQKPDFPQGFLISSRSVAFLSQDIISWSEAQPTCK